MSFGFQVRSESKGSSAEEAVHLKLRAILVSVGLSGIGGSAFSSTVGRLGLGCFSAGGEIASAIANGTVFAISGPEVETDRETAFVEGEDVDNDPTSLQVATLSRSCVPYKEC